MRGEAVCLTISEHGADTCILELCTSFDDMVSILIICLFLWFISKVSAKTNDIGGCKKTAQASLLDAPPSPLSAQSSCFEDEEYDGYDAYLHRYERVLEVRAPGSTFAERQRFLAARNGNVAAAAVSLSRFLDWLSIHESYERQLDLNSPRFTTGDKDLDDWNISCAVAMKAGNEDCSMPLPRVIRTYQIDGSDVCDRHGYQIFHIIPAQMDDRLVGTATYALATALYINRKLDRESLVRISVCMDVRAGKGWRNIHAARLVPFMKQTTQLLLSLFPERLHKCLVYPVPSAFMFLWHIIQQCIDKETSEKILLCPGVNKIESPPPVEHMRDSMTIEVVNLLERSRILAFKE